MAQIVSAGRSAPLPRRDEFGRGIENAASILSNALIKNAEEEEEKRRTAEMGEVLAKAYIDVDRGVDKSTIFADVAKLGPDLIQVVAKQSEIKTANCDWVPVLLYVKFIPVNPRL